MIRYGIVINSICKNAEAHKYTHTHTYSLTNTHTHTHTHTHLLYDPGQGALMGDRGELAFYQLLRIQRSVPVTALTHWFREQNTWGNGNGNGVRMRIMCVE